MSKVLIIKGADFSENKIDTIIIGIESPVITFNQETSLCTITSPSGNPVYYTINGDIPTISSTLYNQPFSVEDGDVVKARAYNVSKKIYSETTTEIYVNDGKIYELLTQTVFNGTNQIDTGVKILDNGTYTVLIDCDITGYASGQTMGAILSAQAIRIWGADNIRIKGVVADGSNHLEGVEILNSGEFKNTNNLKIAVTVNGTSVRTYNNKTNQWKSFTNGDNAGDAQYNALLFGWTDNSGIASYARRAIGTVRSCIVYNKVLTDNIITDWCGN